MASHQGSATVRIQYPPGQAPQTLDAAAAALAEFGDIARLDMSLVFTTGTVLVTYFDVRCAQRVLVSLAGTAETFPAAPHDFRSVRVSSNDFMKIAGSSGFGEVAGVSIIGNDMLIEFFDLRAAQRAEEFAQQFRVQALLMQSTDPAQPQMAAAGLGTLNAACPDIMPFLDVAKMSLAADVSQQALQVASETLGQGNARKDQSNRSSPGKPVREKVSSKDLQQFEIDVSAIENGQDERTTVMLRNMSKACSRDDFLKLLGQAGLADRITFLYMPFDKRRNVHCGFAFINFSTPEDVLLAVRSMQAGLWKGIVARNASMPPAISYARLQGHDELVRHFSLSAVMYDDDARKRPLFVPGSKSAAKAEWNGKTSTKMTQRSGVDASSMLPVYITPGITSLTCENGGFSSSGSEGGAQGAGPVAGA